MDLSYFLLGMTALSGSLTGLVTTPPFEPGLRESASCIGQVWSKGAVVRCLEQTNFEMCSLTDGLFGSMWESSFWQPGVPTPHEYTCKKLKSAELIGNIKRTHPEAVYCGLDMAPTAKDPFVKATKRDVQVETDLWKQYVVRGTLYDLVHTPSDRAFLCNVVWAGLKSTE